MVNIKKIPLKVEITKKFLLETNEVLASIDKKDSLEIEIDSNGGDYNSATSFARVISTYADSTGIVLNNAYSSAFLILQCCNTRVAHKDAKLLLHFPNLGKGEMKLRHLRVFYNFLLFLSRRSKRSVEALWNLAVENRIISAQEAFSLGFVDLII